MRGKEGGREGAPCDPFTRRKGSMLGEMTKKEREKGSSNDIHV